MARDNHRKITTVLAATVDEVPWHLRAPGELVGIDAVGAWEYTVGNPQIKVVVFDVGVDVAHPDLVENIDLFYAIDFDHSLEGRQGDSVLRIAYKM